MSDYWDTSADADLINSKLHEILDAIKDVSFELDRIASVLERACLKQGSEKE